MLALALLAQRSGQTGGDPGGLGAFLFDNCLALGRGLAGKLSFLKGDVVLPHGAKYDPTVAGTFTLGNPIVQAFLQLGWTWGGNWTSPRDYQHFEKPLKK